MGLGGRTSTTSGEEQELEFYGNNFNSRADNFDQSILTSSDHNTISTTEKTTIDLSEEADLIRRDVGRSVLFRYFAAQQQQSQQEQEVSVEDYDDDDDDDLYGSSFDWRDPARPAQVITPADATDRLTRVLQETIFGSDQNDQQHEFHYYQGLHDLSGVMLHNLAYDEDSTIQMLRQLCQSHLRDALRVNFRDLSWLLDNLVLPLVEQIEPHVHYMLRVCNVEMSNVCLPWLITWFTHDVHDEVVSGRLVDAFVASHPSMPMYLGVALLTHPLLKRELVREENEDPSLLYPLLKDLPKHIISDTDAPSGGGTPTSFGSCVTAQELIEDAIFIM